MYFAAGAGRSCTQVHLSCCDGLHGFICLSALAWLFTTTPPADARQGALELTKNKNRDMVAISCTRSYRVGVPLAILDPDLINDDLMLLAVLTLTQNTIALGTLYRKPVTLLLFICRGDPPQANPKRCVIRGS